MPHRPTVSAALAAVLGVTGAIAGPVSAVQASPPPAHEGCIDGGRALGFEEGFLAKPEPRRFIEGGGFAGMLSDFQGWMCDAPDLDSARMVVTEVSRELWRTAVDRAQGRVQMGTLSAGDDRPLYWTRLSMTAFLHQWSPAYEVSDQDRAALVAEVDRISRGQDDLRFSAAKGMKKILVTGFDPFTLWRDVRQANPSGASALALDGKVIKTPNGPVRIEAALFPVRWRDFEDGMVEEALAPHLEEGRRQVDMWITSSQGRVGRIDIERFNGAWRAGFNDNENVCYRGIAPIAEHVPTVTPQPQWTTSSLPIEEMLKAGTGPFPVYDNRVVSEVPGSTPAEPVTTSCPAAPSPGATRPDGPTEGSQARSGGGGNYLSNEIAYRATLLRDALGVDLPGGHVHTPVLQGLSATDKTELSNPTFEGNRAAISAQIRALILAAAATLG